MTASYIGAKIIAAWEQEKDGEPGYAVAYSDNYTSWSPKAVFEEAYRPVTAKEKSLLDRYGVKQ